MSTTCHRYALHDSPDSQQLTAAQRIFLIKFHKPDHREQLLIDSGFRCHLTEYARTTAAAPTTFVAKLRKYLKTRRVTSVAQIGTDRILELQFSDGLYRLYLEFYAGGNIVLTDADLKVLALLRNVDEGEEHERLRVGLDYNLSLRQNYGGAPELTKERIREGLQKTVDRQQAQPAATGKKARKVGKDALRKALAVSITECPPLLVDHALHVAGYDSTIKPEQVLADEDLLDKLLVVLKDARKITDEITENDQTKGYILAKPNPAASNPEDEGPEKSKHLYDDFHPYRPQQFETSEYTFLEFDGFNKAVDEFFSSIEGQKLESRLTEREQQAKKKLEKARKEHEDRIGGLQQVQELNFRKAEAILANVHRVAEATEAVNGLIRQGMDWGDIARLIEREQGQGNAVAETIKMPLKLHENTITLLLDETSFNQNEEEDDEGNETSSVSEDSEEEDDSPKKKAAPVKVAAQPKLSIDIDLALSPWANSTEYYDQKKTAASKEDRTVQASTRALKSHEKKVAEDLKKGLKQEKDILRPVRKQHWFEKYIYFISSDGYMVLGGKDAQQNEIIYKKYFRKGDVYVHADLKGAVPMIIKNKPTTPDAPIPPSTLSQAGHLCVCSSEAWESKAVMSAWWVLADQVSKTGQMGEFLPPGMFNIKGKKEYLPPAQLIVGLAVMFEISEASKARHNKHRVLDGVNISAVEMAPEPEEPKVEEEEKDVGSDDDEFPDAKLASDSDEDFPDAKMDHTEESDAESDAGRHVNPLQSRNADAHNDSEDEEEAQPTTDDPEVVMSGGRTGASQDADENDDLGSMADSEQSKGPARRHLSAKERRLLKKGQLPSPPEASSETAPQGDTADGDESASGGEDTQAPNKSPGTVTTQASKATNAPLSRGKRSKAKKLAAKYAAQDQDDRALAMRLLGSKSGQVAAETAADDKRQKEEEAAASKQRRREQHARAQATGIAAEQARQAAHAQDDDDENDEALRTNLLNLDAFTGRPLPGDDLLAAIPVCAPWSALSAYKYKAKMQPGSTKRGKAVKEVLTIWDHAGKDGKATDSQSQDVERIWPKEMELIRAWKDVEVVGVVPVSKVRVMIAGGRAGAAAAKGKAKPRGGRGSKKK
jgi:predicted ribosome quality control (RQC) complex YloA/Tae2 family protein